MGRVTLGELIEQVRDKTGDSYRELAQRAQRAGYSLTGASIHRLASAKPKTFPEPPTLRALAAALDVSVNDVAIAALESFGIALASPETVRDSRARSWLTLTSGRTDKQVAHLLAVAKTVAEAFDEAEDDQSEPAPRGDEDQQQ